MARERLAMEERTLMMYIPLIVTSGSLSDCWAQAEQAAFKEMNKRGFTSATVKQGNTAVIPAFHVETFPRLVVKKGTRSQYSAYFTIEMYDDDRV